MSNNFNIRTCGTAESKGSNDEWTAIKVAKHFREAIITLKKLPSSGLKGYFTIWPDIVYTPNEMIFQGKKPLKILATPDAISRLDKTFEWMAWISVEERKLIWMRAAKVKWGNICLNMDCCRATAWKKWNFALERIAKRLNNSYN